MNWFEVFRKTALKNVKGTNRYGRVMNPLPLLSQEKHDHYFNRATSEEVCIAVLLLHFLSDFCLSS